MGRLSGEPYFCPMARNAAFISPFVGDWTFEEFVAFLLIYVSYADLEFSDSEKQAIIGRCGEDTFDRVHRHFHSLGEYQRLDFILRFKPLYFPDEEQKTALLRMITHQFQQDGEVSKLEINLYEFLRRLL